MFEPRWKRTLTYLSQGSKKRTQAQTNLLYQFTYRGLKNYPNPIFNRLEPPDSQRIRDPFTFLYAGCNQMNGCLSSWGHLCNLGILPLGSGGMDESSNILLPGGATFFFMFECLHYSEKFMWTWFLINFKTFTPLS